MTMLALTPLMPILGALIIGTLYLFVGSKINRNLYSTIAVLGPAISFVMSVVIFFNLKNNIDSVSYLYYKAFDWIDVGSLQLGMDFYVDTLGSTMLLFITLIGTLIHIYSIGYLHDDEKIGKYFAYLNLFLGSMLILVLAGNPIVMFIGWEGVGLCSYLLISYYFSDDENVYAGNKAFTVNRIGDFGFMIGIALLFLFLGEGSMTFMDLAKNAPTLSSGWVLVICLLLFVGAAGKSAQAPLYVWLPDAMAGPTPVSALMHAATMVTAGVFMVTRYSFLFDLSQIAGHVVAIIGAFTALLAALIAVYQNDIKKILAYSTVSQLGYMFVGVGLGAYTAGMFHVFTHAFFKALLFLAAGSVIMGMHHKQNIWKMGGLKDKMKVTYFLTLIGALALAGVPPFAGFFSKDEILLMALASGHEFIWLTCLMAAGLTAFYVFRMFFVVFYQTPKTKYAEEAHESPKIMTVPMGILAIGAAFAGFLGLPHLFGIHNQFHEWLIHSMSASYMGIDHISIRDQVVTMGASIAFALLGISVAYRRFYRFDPRHKNVKGWYAKFASNKFYVDEVYDILFVQSIRLYSSILNYLVEKFLIQGLMTAAVAIYKFGGSIFSMLQNGKVGHYALMMALGITVLTLIIIRGIGI